MSFVAPAGTESIAHPLDELYAHAGLTLPPLEVVDAVDVPEPYRTLLVHQSDMTSTLENFYGSPVRVEVLRREERGTHYYREVALRLEHGGKAVEFGAIKINLALFPSAARKLILAERWPLGRILKECDVEYASRPRAFLRVASDPLINRVLGLEGAQRLYGRRNTLYDKQDRSLADIVEILPVESIKKGTA